MEDMSTHKDKNDDNKKLHTKVTSESNVTLNVGTSNQQTTKAHQVFHKVKPSKQPNRYVPYVVNAQSREPVLAESVSSSRLIQTGTYGEVDHIRKSFSVPNELSGQPDGDKIAKNSANGNAIRCLGNLPMLAHSACAIDNLEDRRNAMIALANSGNNAAKIALLQNIQRMQWLANVRRSAAMASVGSKVKEIVNCKPKASSRDLFVSQEMTKKQTALRYHISEDLNTKGFCVLDNFLGSTIANLIKENSRKIYEKGEFKSGKLLGKGKRHPPQTIRGDKITWATGREPECADIRKLMWFVDTLMCSGVGMLPQHNISGGTKAMLACYPGNGEGYQLHVDNPIRDGRCITCIYYLNENWDSKKMGGDLRLHASTSGRTAEIAPKLDRVIIFYSDKRNPHEVLPAFNNRMAITLWYFDSEERMRYLRNTLMQ